MPQTNWEQTTKSVVIWDIYSSRDRREKAARGDVALRRQCWNWKRRGYNFFITPLHGHAPPSPPRGWFECSHAHFFIPFSVNGLQSTTRSVDWLDRSIVGPNRHMWLLLLLWKYYYGFACHEYSAATLLDDNVVCSCGVAVEIGTFSYFL